MSVASTISSGSGCFSALQRAEIAEICGRGRFRLQRNGFSALQRAEIAEIGRWTNRVRRRFFVSVLFNEPKLLKSCRSSNVASVIEVSVLFNEPKLLKFDPSRCSPPRPPVSVLFNEPKLLKYVRFANARISAPCFSALQRAEIAEIQLGVWGDTGVTGFSALQRAEIAEILQRLIPTTKDATVSVLFNEPKLLKSTGAVSSLLSTVGFSALQRAEIAEIRSCGRHCDTSHAFQCSSTSRNC